ncbi:ABC transporter ATP-binding protein [Caldivirga maquilingensis]|uniref:Oligopeptide/dipeptide ABC transporter, ATPase subunit n=1 Tax=Caldivirga maquilingensis (strain ATCC 700844 / DSM 13496 / JCM 10307 / IC-167) TaxID=397948 RepID=A8M8T4_CALMQ|nr:ABC transporter ATP-binding protein [Caldivirga maquilingensis]ABW02153.1 oligopeptide/dipeptide ABC transporter, ATPase subunit [Caldivirga maquilingensis IC-167]
MALLEVKDLSVTYRTPFGTVKALDDVSFTLNEGEAIAVVGESGSGKSTLALAISRLLPPNARFRGSIIFEGVDLARLSPSELRVIRGTGIFMVFQEPANSLNPVYRIKDQLMEAVRIRRLRSNEPFDEGEALKEIISTLRDVRMPDPEIIIERYPHQLSGGQIQRIMIAMGLLMRPKLYIADEPTSALDVTVQAQILKLLKDLKNEYNLSIIFITHDLAVASIIGDKVMVMYAGQIVEEGLMSDVITKPYHPYTQGLLSSLPRISKYEGKLPIISGAVPSLINPPSGCRFHPRCPYATDTCIKVMPQLKNVENRRVRCHLYA